MISARHRLLLLFVYGALGAACLFQTKALVYNLTHRPLFGGGRFYFVNVQGDVGQPGKYRVPQGATRFEILKVAGIRPTSDLSALALTQQVAANENVAVPAMPAPVALVPEKPAARLEFFLGDLNIIDRDGRNRPQQEGLMLNNGDRVLTEAKTQAEFSIGAKSRVDLNDFAELTFDKIASTENDKSVTAISQKAGLSWYKFVYASKNELYQVRLPLVMLTVAGSGANCMVDIQMDHITIYNIDGLLLLERLKSSEALNLISGQSVTIWADGRPFVVTGIGADVNPNERFSGLLKEKTNYLLRHMPLNFVFCGLPSSYYFISLQFANGAVSVVKIPAETDVGQFVQGFSTISEAYLYGGGVMVSTLVERLLNSDASKYCVLNKEDIIRIAASLGGVTVQVDEKAAAILQSKKGLQKIGGYQIAEFLNPSVS
ncbi:MAG: LCP family protein, partial [Chitinivibrionales bacterium]|nr:LCP family protein [Chitinivibrionales bacterium]